MIRLKIPSDAKKYHDSQTFTKDTVPAALTSRHDTKEGVWVKLIVTAGPITMTLCEGGSVDLFGDDHFIVAPQVPHYVTLGNDSSFRLEFYRVPKV